MRNRNIGGTKEVFTNASVSVSNKVPANGANTLLLVSGTLPAIPVTNNPVGVLFNITSAGSTSLTQLGAAVLLNAGYTGINPTTILYVQGHVAGTDTNLFGGAGGGRGNSGLSAIVDGNTTGSNIGVFNRINNNTGDAYGTLNRVVAATGNAFGSMFLASGGVNNTGIHSVLGTSPGTIVTAAGLFDNGVIAAPILILRNNNTEVLSVYQTLTDNSKNFLRVTGTLPSVPTATVEGVIFSIASSGSASFVQGAVDAVLQSGYTGAERTWGLRGINSAAGTSVDYAGVRHGNYGVFGQSNANTVGVNVAVGGFASNDGAGTAFGILGLANTASAGSAKRVGVIGLARQNTANNTGGFFGLNTSAPTIPDAGLVADSGNSSGTLTPVFIGQSNGVHVFSIQYNGGIRVKSASLGSVTLDSQNHVIRCDATAGAINLVLPIMAAANRGIWYRIKKIDATANTVTITAGVGDTIDGAATKVLAAQYDSVDIIAPDAGTDWALFGISSGGIGPTGATGRDGAPGKDGEDGQDGFPGIKGDTGASGGGGGTFGQVTADFGVASPSPDSVTVAVIDAAVTALSRILCSVQPGAGRDLDELELGPVLVYAGDIVAGVGFNVIATAPDSTADGSFLINYTRD